MAEKFLMPKLSPTMEEGQISRWSINEGDAYNAGDTLAEVDTDKATMEMTALTGGTLLKILKGAGETAALGEAIAITGNEGEDISGLLSEVSTSAPAAPAAKPEPPASPGGNGQNAEKSMPEPAVAATPVQQPTSAAPSAPPVNGGGSQSNGRLIVSPIAARM